MQVPLEISFKDIDKTPDLEELINQKVDKLEKICDHIISCRVMVERPQKYPDRGNPHRVRVDITVPPSHEIVAKQTASEGEMHDPLPVIISKTFQAAERQLKELTERQRGEVKTHPNQQAMGIVQRLFPEENYGFIKTVDTGEDIYFHRNSVLNDDYDRLVVGAGVRFMAQEGEKGLQASTVEIVFKPGPGVST